jgi:hypothetical protein
MNTLQRLGLFQVEITARRTISTDLEVVCLWTLLGLVLAALFLSLGFRLDIDQALMLAG